jgi:hypothetical protein
MELYKYEAVLRDLYHEQKMTMAEVGKELECSASTINRWLDKLDIESRGQYEEIRKRPACYYWKNGYEVSSSGFDDNDVYIHRLIAVAKYGVDEVKNMEVHHKNEIRWDNRPENLELMTPEEHMKHHHN